MPVTADPRPYHHGNVRSALLEAAERGLREHGADQISLRDLAREIGVSHAAPRRYFADRQALLDALAVTGFTRLGDTLRTALVVEDDDEDEDDDAQFPCRVRRAVAALAAFATDNASLYELMNSGKHRPGAGRIAEAADEAFTPMSALIEEGQERGLLEAGRPERVGLILFATVQGITTMINAGTVEAALMDELIEMAVSQFLRGMHP